MFAIVAFDLLTQWTVFGLISLLIFLIYHRTNYDFDFWKRQGVKGPKPLPYFGNLLQSFFKPIVHCEEENFKKYGKIYGYYEKNKPILSVSDPSLIKQIIIKDSNVVVNRRETSAVDKISAKMLTSLRDDDWKRVRSIMSPTFTSGKIKRTFNTIAGCTENIKNVLESKVEKDEYVDVKSIFGAFTMDVVASVAFATKTDAYENPNHPFVKNANTFIKIKLLRLLLFFIIPKFVRQLFNFNLPPNSSVIFFKRIVLHLIEQRKAGKVKANDFLQLLLDAEQNSTNLAKEIKDINEGHFTSDTAEEVESSEKLLKAAKNENKRLTEDEIIAQSLLFFVAGYETTASLLSFCSYCLAVNKKAQDLLYDEVKTNVTENEEIDYEKLNSLPYLNAVLSETLRLYPPVIKIERDVSQDYKLPNTNITVPKGGRIAIPIYVIHHDPENFPHPKSFKPERFLPENAHEIKPYTYLPFSTGPRNCIGMRFALIEAKLALCKVILSYEFIACDKTDIPLEPVRTALILNQVKRIILKVRKRAQ